MFVSFTIFPNIDGEKPKKKSKEKDKIKIDSNQKRLKKQIQKNENTKKRKTKKHFLILRSNNFEIKFLFNLFLLEFEAICLLIIQLYHILIDKSYNKSYSIYHINTLLHINYLSVYIISLNSLDYFIYNVF